MSPKAAAILRGIGTAAFWLAVWEGVSRLVHQVLLVPGPLLVGRTLLRLGQTAAFWQAVGWTLLRISLGFLAATLAGVLLALLTFRVALARQLLLPLRRGIRAVPVASFIILALVWLPTNTLPVFISFLMVLPLVWSEVEQGLSHTDPRLLDMARVFRLTPAQALWKVRLPSVLPYFRNACVNGLGLAWKSGVAAEVICRPPHSIGRLLQEAKIYLETPEVFAWTAVVVLLSLLLEKLLAALIRRAGTRRERRGIRTV